THLCWAPSLDGCAGFVRMSLLQKQLEWFEHGAFCAAAVRHESFRHQSEQTGSPVLRATNIAPGYAVMFAVPIPDRAKPTGSAAILTEAAS
ncbi:MAG TPA: hypothetical protein VF492_02685, partial [Verrucomicrobiae bacterium]